MKRIYISIQLLIFFILIYNLANGQIIPLKSDLLKLTFLSDSATKKQPAENLYLQFDKTYYAIGDTIWFKAYLLNSAYLTASAKSGIMYVDIANDSDQVISQYRIKVTDGLAWGNICLNEKDFSTGTYTIRAYTNWMRNRGGDDFFYKRFYISSAGESNLLVNSRFTSSITNGDDILNARLLFANVEKTPYAVEPLQLQVMEGDKRLYRQKLQTGVDGVLNVNFKLPAKARHLFIIAESEKKDKRMVIPIMLHHPENTDVQFLSEGGNLVAGLPAHIGFKAIDEAGKGVNISGVIIDGEQKQVATFQSLHNGMGSFDLPVAAGETYTAKVKLPGGTIKNYPFPASKTSGTILQVNNNADSDSLELSVAATADIVHAGDSFYLIGRARGIVCYAAIISFHNKNGVTRKIAKSLFPTGITHFTLMTTTKYQPINERMIFIDHLDNLNINMVTGKPIYGARDSIALHLKVTDKQGSPVTGSFSLAVTDDEQVKTDLLNDENILTRMQLTSDLKGFIEEPGYYLSADRAENRKALDNLLLTQGWVGYNWQQVFNPPAVTYQPETDLRVKGHVLNVLNKPLKGTDVLLFSKSPAILMDTVTNKDGEFLFDHFPRVDTPIFIIKAVNKNGKSFNVNIKVDEVRPPLFIKPSEPKLIPWYMNSDTTLLNYTKTNASAMKHAEINIGGQTLREVKITAKRIVTVSSDFQGIASVVLNEKDMEKAGKKSLFQVLEENVKGFHETVIHGFRWYFIDSRTIIVSVDGIYLYSFYPNFNFDVLTWYLKNHNAEDIKGIAVVPAGEYNIFISMTSRRGSGPNIDTTPGLYLFKPLAITYPKEFYKPKYQIKDAAGHLPDLRSTIDWEPNIVTDAKGEATVWFYAADKKATYTLTMEGTDLNGGLGYKQEKIYVNKVPK